ncbi:MAG: UDP-N-acetyl-D-glucosamine 6-dehydrogenase [Owenweeksia sp. TMED14]|nr:MAG: UDP-N-acetyl-D-glucosamine 6-dehydrogenase [Owenweeksia sp. TMED14]
MQKLKDSKIAIIGLGYVGLPLAVEFSKKYSTVGFDINKNRVNELNHGTDSTLEVDDKSLKSALDNGLTLSNDLESITSSNVFIVTVPTPINKDKTPDLKPLDKASEMLGPLLKKGDIVIYESTTYPGCTEEFCVPILESSSNLIYNEDFFCGYSPERINPGDKKNTLTKIVKVTSGSNPKTALFVDELYQSIIDAGTHLAPSMAVAEASKAIENAQRDVNISFVNELSLIFDRLNIDTREVLEAASTKWNFLNYTPGLVGGHCIGVDPYYLAHKAQTVGYEPQVILSGRRVNDAMGIHVASTLMKLLISKNIPIKKSKVLILGITFKENCPDIRNTKIIDVINELKEFRIDVDVFDPNANHDEVEKELGIKLLTKINDLQNYDGIILAVAHQEFMSLNLKSMPNQVIYDLKGIYPKENVDKRL